MQIIRKLLVVISFLILIQTVNALDVKNYDINFDIKPDKTVQQTIIIELENVTEDTKTHIILEDLSNLRIYADNKVPPFYIKEEKLNMVVYFTVFKNTKKIYLIFDSENLIYSRDNVLQFFSSIKPPKTNHMNITVSLPEGWIIYRDSVNPEGSVKKTDGERIQIQWNFVDVNDKIFISVSYYKPGNSLMPIIILIFLFIFSILIFLIHKYRKISETEFLRGFSEDERKAIEYLRINKLAYQNKIEKEFNFSRAKMTRIAKKLESCGLIKREITGRTRKITWIK